MAFLKQQGIRGTALGVTSHDWPQYTEEEPEIYEQEALDKFFAECDADELLRYEFFMMTGMREQEVIYATDLCVDFANCTVSVKHNPSHGWAPKMYKERTIPVPQYLVDKLKAMLVKRGKGGLLFPTANGLPKFDFLDGAKAIARRSGLPEDTVYLHKFRSTFATRSLWANVDLRTVQMWMGHTDLASTMRYLKPNRGKEVRDKVESIWTTA
jgi:integrase/recombinase XerD